MIDTDDTKPSNVAQLGDRLPGEPQPPIQRPESTDEQTTHDTPRDPQAPTGKILMPEKTKGFYVVLAAKALPKNRTERAPYMEVACVEANDAAQAKRIVMNQDGPLGDWLRHQAGDGKGIRLQAVPALNWKPEVEPTSFERPAPILTIH